MVTCITWIFLALHSGTSAANSHDEAQLYDIDIPSMNAAEALNSLAEQTGAIMLFPYDLAESRQANEVVGRYTLTGALSELLEGSGLSSGLSDKRVIQIALDEPEIKTKRKGNGYRKSTVKKKVGTFVASLFVATGASAQDTAGQTAPTNRWRKLSLPVRGSNATALTYRHRWSMWAVRSYRMLASDRSH